MKKYKRPKLVLSKETIKNIDEMPDRAVVGGTSWISNACGPTGFSCGQTYGGSNNSCEICHQK